MQTDQQSYAEIIAADMSATLDDILSRWHHWQQGHVGVRGFGNRSLVTGDYRVSRQYDDANGALDAGIERSIMHDVDFAATELADPYRAAIYAQARCLSLGLAVFRSPRVPEGEAGRIVLATARRLMTQRLVSAGVM